MGLPALPPTISVTPSSESSWHERFPNDASEFQSLHNFVQQPNHEDQKLETTRKLVGLLVPNSVSSFKLAESPTNMETAGLPVDSNTPRMAVSITSVSTEMAGIGLAHRGGVPCTA